MKFITFQKPNLNYLFFIAYFATILFKDYLSKEVFEVTALSGLFFQTYFTILSHALAIIPFLISKYLSRKKKNSQEKSIIDNTIILIHKDNIIKYKGKNLFKYTLLTSLFDFLSEAILCIFFFIYNDIGLYKSYSLSIFTIINCVLLYIISYFILKTNFYKHHYLSFFINFICFLIDLIIDISQIIKLKITDYRYYIYVFIRIIRLAFYSILDSYAKLAMHSASLSPYTLLFYTAIYEVPFLIIFSIPFFFITFEDLDGTNDIIFKGFLKYFTGIKILFSILLFINAFLTNLFLMYIVDRFSPSHLALAILLKPFAKNIYDIFEYLIKGENVYWYKYVNIFIFLFVIIGSMIHNEIFIINKWGLNKKTKLFLNKEFTSENSDIERFESDYDFELNEEKNDNENEIDLLIYS